MVPVIHTADKEIPWRELILPWHIVRRLHQRGELILQFTKRDVLSRYRGSYLGMFWSLLRPLSMLALYTVVFGYIFESKLGGHANESKLDFTLALFCGLILFDFLAECLARAPMLVLANPNYVTKVVFPLEILPVMAIGAALTQLIISCIPLLIALFLSQGSIPGTALYLPLIVVPLVLLCLGLTWLSGQPWRVHPRHQRGHAGDLDDRYVRQRDLLFDPPRAAQGAAIGRLQPAGDCDRASAQRRALGRRAELGTIWGCSGNGRGRDDSRLRLLHADQERLCRRALNRRAAADNHAVLHLVHHIARARDQRVVSRQQQRLLFAFHEIGEQLEDPF